MTRQVVVAEHMKGRPVVADQGCHVPAPDRLPSQLEVPQRRHMGEENVDPWVSTEALDVG